MNEPRTSEGGNDDRLGEIERIVNDEVNWSAHVRAGLEPISHEQIAWLVDRIEELEAEIERLRVGWGLAASYIPAARWEDYKRRRDDLQLLDSADA